MDDELLLHGLVHLLGEVDGIRVVGDLRHDGDLVERLARAAPELLIVDAGHGLQLAALRRHLDPVPRIVVVMDGEESPGHALDLVRAGADALVDRRSPSVEVLSAVARVLDGQTALDPHSASTLVDELRAQATPAEHDSAGLLTRREKEVLALLTEGLDNRAIATDLFISEATVKFHLHNIMDKFGVHKRAALVSAALRGRARGGVGGHRPAARTR
ncbi:response regulator transcription factor [Mycobacterium yunnanensis]|nr:response regulator transcription factor [Mycobacterium yunnanensis]